MRTNHKRIIVSVLAIIMSLTFMAGCDGSSSTNNYPPAATAASVTTAPETTTKAETTKSTKSFTNKYGTPTTKCAHSGCDNYIASSGDTNCCTKHSKRCANCGCYIDEDATYCMDCIKNALS